jgi:hypothetical protein
MSDAASAVRTILVYQPQADESPQDEPIAKRPASLNGAVIGLLDNTKDLADKLLEEVRDLLHKDWPTAQFRRFRKKSVSGADADMLERLATCDAVVTAVGD